MSAHHYIAVVTEEAKAQRFPSAYTAAMIIADACRFPCDEGAAIVNAERIELVPMFSDPSAEDQRSGYVVKFYWPNRADPFYLASRG